MKGIFGAVVAVLLLVGTEGGGDSCNIGKGKKSLRKALCEVMNSVEKLQELEEDVNLLKMCTAKAPENGEVDSTTVEHGASVRYICKNWYNLVGDETRLCEAGRLSGTEPICEPKVSESCPVEYETYGDSAFQYKICPTCESWGSAREICQEDGGELLTLHNDEEFDFFLDLTENANIATCPAEVGKGVWIGGTDQEHEGTWTWVDGTPLSKEDPHWHNGEPNNVAGREHCLKVWLRHGTCKLNDSACYKKIHFICKRNL